MATMGDPAPFPPDPFDDDEDDEFANLFSFATAPPQNDAEPPSQLRSDTTLTESSYSGNARDSSIPLSVTDDGSATSEDSFLMMLEQQKEPVTFLDAVAVTPSKDKLGTKVLEGTDLQAMLDWLDHDDDAVEQAAQKEREEEEAIQPPKTRDIVEEEKKDEISSQQEPQFQSLGEAVRSSQATLKQIRGLLLKEEFVVSPSLRPYLWCRVVCGKTLGDTLVSSVADSFEKWELSHQHLIQSEKGGTSQNNIQLMAVEDGDGETGDPSTNESRLSEISNAKREWIMAQAEHLSDRIVAIRKVEKEDCRRELAALLLNHYFTSDTVDEDGPDASQTNMLNSDKVEGTKSFTESTPRMDTLLPPVACTLLCAGIPKTAAAVVLSHMVPHFMPILALTHTEREDAAQLLHRQFYLLTAYHLPSLVLHLDRYLPNWYLWPNFHGDGPKEGQGGYIPSSYLLSHLAGECGKTQLRPQCILPLWDVMLTSSNSSLRYFVVLAALEEKAHEIVLLTDEDLPTKVVQVLNFQPDSNGDPKDTDDTHISNQYAMEWVQKWTDKAQLLWERTPVSLSRRLRRIEDTAVTQALTKRQQEAEERMKQKLDAEAKAHQEALEAERERKADEARLRLTRARLVAFYRQYNPGKESNIDKIMESYQNRYEVLDAKLKQKYGVGFNPALKPKQVQKVIKDPTPAVHSKKKSEVSESSIAQRRKRNQIVAKVSPSEVLPLVCRGENTYRVQMTKLELGNKLEEKVDALIPLRFHLVDSRPAETIQSQGRLPISVTFPPEDLLDVHRIKEQEDKFETLRGSVHIVIMGEGFAALPALYGHKMTQSLSDCIVHDDTRNNNCALFFLKKGFPFISILDGGFAGAHSFLSREGPKHGLHIHECLADYDPEISIFGQFERVHNSTSREKAQRALQNIFDSSMVALTKNSLRLENIASELVQPDQQRKGGNMVSRFFAVGNDGGKKDQGAVSVSHERNDHKAGQPVFRNPFGRKSQATTSNDSVSDDTESQSASEKTDKIVPNAMGDSTPEVSGERPIHLPLAGSQSPDAVKPAEVTRKEGSLDQPKSNPFAGFGAAFKHATSKASDGASNAGVKNTRVMGNPFARFNQSGRNLDRSRHGLGSSQHGMDRSKHGLGGSKHGLSNSKHGATRPGLGSLNQLRKNAFARIRDGTSDQPESLAAKDEPGEPATSSDVLENEGAS